MLQLLQSNHRNVTRLLKYFIFQIHRSVLEVILCIHLQMEKKNLNAVNKTVITIVTKKGKKYTI